MEEDVSEATLIANFLDWARKNEIRMSEHPYEIIEEYILRYLMAGG